MKPIAYRQALDNTVLGRPFCRVCFAYGDCPTEPQQTDFSTIQHGQVWDGEKMAPCFVGEAQPIRFRKAFCAECGVELFANVMCGTWFHMERNGCVHVGKEVNWGRGGSIDPDSKDPDYLMVRIEAAPTTKGTEDEQ